MPRSEAGLVSLVTDAESQSKLPLDVPLSCKGRQPGSNCSGGASCHHAAFFPRGASSSLAFCTLWCEPEVPASLD